MCNSFEIHLPLDNDGYVLLKCPRCGEPFKITSSDYNDDSVGNLWCPSCGLVSASYLTEDVVDLAMNMATDIFLKELHKELKDLERKTRNSLVQIKAGKETHISYEDRLTSVVDALVVKHFSCCDRTAKVPVHISTSATYCPFCGVIHFETD